MKSVRHDLILDIIDKKDIETQEELAAEQAHQHAQRGKLPGPVGRGCGSLSPHPAESSWGR